MASKRGRPKRTPRRLCGDRAYDSPRHRLLLWLRRIEAVLAPRHTGHGSGLGTVRWVVERTLSWLHHFRRLRVRYERRGDIHEAFLKLACVIICSNTLFQSF